ncbi:BRCT domain-containing protein [Tessaracoccus rhinocerotis]
MPMGTYSSTGKALTLGPAKATLVAAQLASPYYQTLIGKLERAGVTTTATASTDDGVAGNTDTAAGDASAGSPLSGMNVVVSGTVPGYSRTTVAEAIEAAGGRASGSVSATTSLLVSEPSSTSKYVKAQQLGVRIVTPSEFLTILHG